MNTDARIVAMRYYRRAGRSLQDELMALAANPLGVIVYSPSLVVMMKPVASRRMGEWEKLTESPADADGWYVHLLAGDLQQARRMAHLLPEYRWLCFQRGMRHARPHRLNWHRVRL